jgi:predicted glutamine amidotransferase
MGLVLKEHCSMCIIILQKENTSILSDNTLNRCHSVHKDGCGLMYIQENALAITKTLNFDTFKESYKRIHKKFNNKPIGIHFRTGTGGGKNVENCHPFIVHNNLAFMHNGILSDINSTKNKSDSNVFNEVIMKPMNEDIIHNESLQTLMEQYVGYSNKILFMNGKGEYHITNERNGDWKDNIWYSNGTWKPVTRTTYTSSASWDSYERKVTCTLCQKSIKRKHTIGIDSPRYIRYICVKCLKQQEVSVKKMFSSKIWQWKNFDDKL